MLVPEGQEFYIHFGDAIPHMMAEMPPASVDFSIQSPPFPRMFAYTGMAEDIGNSEDLKHDAKIHLGFFYRGLRRVLKPGRVAIIHCMQIPRYKRDGGVGRGLNNFRDLNIRLAERAGLIYEYEWAIRKNPQAQAITTKSRELQFAGLEADRARSRGALPDFLLKFTAPGQNAKPLDSNDQVSRNDWIRLAEYQWEARRYPIGGRKTGLTLNWKTCKGKNDTHHICPLYLSIIHDAVLLFSDPGETVFSAFAGIASEGFPSIRLGRKFYGCEIKQEYYDQSHINLNRAIRMRDGSDQGEFDFGDDDDAEDIEQPSGDEEAFALASEED